METTRILYKELFSIRILHDGFQSDHQSFIADSLRIQPDKETAATLANLNIGYRFYGDSFICFIRSRRVAPPANQPQLPYIENKAGTSLRFLIYSSRDFISKTFAVNAGGKWVYQFSNKTNNIDPGPPKRIFLNQQIEAFDISKDYLAGTIVEDVGDMYAARKTISHLDNIPITNEDNWEDVGDQADQWVNNKDLVNVTDVRPADSCFGVIDIYYTGTTDDYKLFNLSGQLLSPVYTLSLKSRI